MTTAWDAYRPTADNPWTLQKVGHLYRRAAFGATWAELQQGLKDGPEKTIDRLLRGGPAAPDFERTSDFMAAERSLPAGTAGTQLAAWWLARILHTPHPLREKLALFWHNHFATSLAKVRNARFMLEQYRLVYRHALGDFRQLLQEMSIDPAMMVWLDTTESVKGKPNENYARELMELFSLGIGNYTEKDIREAAKAFTGYDIQKGKGHFEASKHDDGTKSVLGKTGNWKAEDVVSICIDQPACPRFIARKLYRFLVSDTEAPPAELINSLADQYRASGFDTAKLVETILRSDHFFGPAAYRRKVKGPVDFAVGIVRGLEGNVGPLPLAQSLENLGQRLFEPPSVKGWDGGPAWLNGQTLLFRQNLALAITGTEDSRFGRRADPVAVLAKHGCKSDTEAAEFFLGLFLQNDVPPETRSRLLSYLDDARAAKFPVYWTPEDVANHRLRTAAHLTLTLPEFQLD
ncbi:DUF1800 domain-containing protein [Fimbriiglobus ruber]|uniref:Uncharacterized protein n=1 Tax=Fimbriiglobus ruber TaxID=1908690 RepID=A0A225E7C0_9BACT|nr:DUF1800 domain-containing protein [Fimbriiglobus ruber]OWK46688.1 hypothetical protein FRUB_00387 [Fimbriiglobus ruber]